MIYLTGVINLGSYISIFFMLWFVWQVKPDAHFIPPTLIVTTLMLKPRILTKNAPLTSEVKTMSQ